jgi:hypothetical protein
MSILWALVPSGRAIGTATAVAESDRSVSLLCTMWLTPSLRIKRECIRDH